MWCLSWVPYPTNSSCPSPLQTLVPVSLTRASWRSPPLPALHRREALCSPWAGGRWGLPGRVADGRTHLVCSPTLRDRSPVLPDSQYLKVVVSHALSGFLIVCDKRIISVHTTSSWPESETPLTPRNAPSPLSLLQGSPHALIWIIVMGACFTCPRDWAHPEGRGLVLFTAASPGRLSGLVRVGCGRQVLSALPSCFGPPLSHASIFRELPPYASQVVPPGPLSKPLAARSLCTAQRRPGLTAGHAGLLPRGFSTPRGESPCSTLAAKVGGPQAGAGCSQHARQTD